MKPFKRKDDRDAPYYVKFEVKKKQYLWSTKTNDLSLATVRAKNYRAAVVAGAYHLVSAMKARNGLPTFKELLAEYDEQPWPSANTRTRNIAAMKMVLGCSRLTELDTIDRLDKNVGLAWQKRGEGEAANKNSVLRKAKSIFSRRALFGYKVEIPGQTVAAFMATPMLREPENRPDIPSPAAMAAAQASIARGTAAFNAFLLAAYAGLRSSEIIAARWDWLVEETIYIGGREFVAKSGKWRAVKLAPDVLAMLHKNGSEHIAGASATQLVQRELPVMLRMAGFTSRNPVHSLRRWYGSHVANTHGLWAAKNALGHSTQAVTEQSYARQLQIASGLSFLVSPPRPAVPQ
jgi:integrase